MAPACLEPPRRLCTFPVRRPTSPRPVFALALARGSSLPGSDASRGQSRGETAPREEGDVREGEGEGVLEGLQDGRREARKREG